MPRWLLGGLGLLLLAAAAWWLFLRDAPPDFRRVANLTAPGETVVFLGDSITRGYGLREEEAFPSLAAAALGIPVVNAGVSGDTTAAALARLDRDVLAHRPRLTLVELGGNDYLRRVPLEQTLANLDAIVERLIADGGMVLILHVSVGVMGDPYLKGFREVATRRGALLVPDIMRGILSDPSLKLDPIHPNARGQQLIAERVVTALRPLLAEAERRRGR
jgi:acyl-CoA thioesterase-1